MALLLATATAAAAAAQPTLRDHPIVSGLPPLYLDGRWTAHRGAQSIDAAVPGDILTDLQRAKVVPDPYFNSSWLEPSFVAAWNEGLWTYNKSFAAPASAGGDGEYLLPLRSIRTGSPFACVSAWA